jgi:hypothetical protein
MCCGHRQALPGKRSSSSSAVRRCWHNILTFPSRRPGPTELDIYPRYRPDLADVIDGAIGADSPFHGTFGYRADGVGPETAEQHLATSVSRPLRNDMTDTRDWQRRAYLDHIFTLMLGLRRDEIAAKTRKVIDLWDAQPGTRRIHSQRWRELLDGDVDVMRAIVMADTPEAAELRHAMPFAGILSNKERAALRAGAF